MGDGILITLRQPLPAEGLSEQACRAISEVIEQEGLTVLAYRFSRSGEETNE